MILSSLKFRKLSLTLLVTTLMAFCIWFGHRLGEVHPSEVGRKSEPTRRQKINELKVGTYHTRTQQTCGQICRIVPAVPPSKEETLFQIGDIAVVPEYDIEGATVNYSVSPTVLGGAWNYKRSTDLSGEECAKSSNAGVAIVIVCKNRWHQLNVTLFYLVPLLQKQQLCYRIFVVEQRNPNVLNKAMLMNVGFMEAVERFQFQCIIFQDADLAPINDWNPYGCDRMTDNVVVHLGVALDNRQYKLRYPKLVGGVLKFSVRNFLAVNGFSNMYWGWGQEDDDMEIRIRQSGLTYVHMTSRIARYHAVPHHEQPKDDVTEHVALLKSAFYRMKHDVLRH